MILRLLVLGLMPWLLLAQIHNFPWPMAPQNQQHRISATFDECREDRDHFHNGTDIPLAPGEEVLAIMGGQVTGIGSDWIRVEDFAYVHVSANPALLVGNTVAQGAVLGWTDSNAHVHLNYGGGASGHPTGNPLLPGGLTPFSDPYHPRSPIIQFVMDGSSAAFPFHNLSGRVDIIAQAADTTDLESSIDMNNGIYTIGWALYSADTSTILTGPHFWFEADELYSNAYINNVYAPGSSTSIYRYIVTNRITSNGFLDCAAYTPGPYVVSVMSSDARDNWDTTYVNVTLSDEDLLPPGQPQLQFIGPDAQGDLQIQWTGPGDADLAGYQLEFSFNGTSWSSNQGSEVLTADMTSYTVPGFPQDTYIQFRLLAVDTAPLPNYSEPSDTYGVRLSSNAERTIIVDGFDRIDGSWNQTQHDFACSYADALIDAGNTGGIATASNEWVVATGNLDNYSSVIWFVGDDSRTAETFSSSEQSIVAAYLAQGGHFFASGAEIGYDLSAGSMGDAAFMNQILHIDYAGDNAGNYGVTGVPPYFSGIVFQYGSTPYVEDWPDYFTPAYGGEIALQYNNQLTAAVTYRDEQTATFVMGFAFETITGAEQRAALMGRVWAFFNGMTAVAAEQQPADFAISAGYPNPFNNAITVAYSIQSTGVPEIAVYDLLGRQVQTYAPGTLTPGYYTWRWNGLDRQGHELPSGVYLLRLIQQQYVAAPIRVLLLK